MNEEIWVDIPNILYYQCSNKGRIRALDRPFYHNHSKALVTRKAQSMKQNIDTCGYFQVSIKNKLYLVHRLVAITFIPNPENKPFINHKNGIKTDNRIENLEWCTRSENAKHSFLIGLQSNKGENHPNHKLTLKDVRDIRSKYIPRIYSSYEIAKEYNLTKTTVLDIIKRKSWNYDNC